MALVTVDTKNKTITITVPFDFEAAKLSSSGKTMGIAYGADRIALEGKVVTVTGTAYYKA